MFDVSIFQTDIYIRECATRAHMYLSTYTFSLVFLFFLVKSFHYYHSVIRVMKCRVLRIMRVQWQIKTEFCHFYYVWTIRVGNVSPKGNIKIHGYCLAGRKFIGYEPYFQTFPSEKSLENSSITEKSGSLPSSAVYCLNTLLEFLGAAISFPPLRGARRIFFIN